MSARPLILGTAGHIDHGKTSLVYALTGVDTDRLPEEKRRGMTIDLGFARLELAGRQVGIVDVPGHERFIRNMAAGATGIDFALVVVAADDGVMPQTREHLDILELLGIRQCVVALNKADLADKEKLECVRREIRTLISGRQLDEAPIVSVSATTGMGVDALRDALAACAEAMPARPWPSVFRLPIDRRFVLQGHGTVITGSLLGGDVKAGDEVELQPQGIRLRVRNVESHGEARTGLESGRRVAVNLPNIQTREIRRGDELAAPGFLKPSARLAARVLTLAGAADPIGAKHSYRLHIGTQETDARFTFFTAGELEPGASRLALVRTKDSVCAAHGQRFIVRATDRGLTIGGGVILATQPGRASHSSAPPWLTQLESSDSGQRILAALIRDPFAASSLPGLLRETAVEPVEAEFILNNMQSAGALVPVACARGIGYWPGETWEERRESLWRLFMEALKSDPLAAGLDTGKLTGLASRLGPPEVLGQLLDQLAAAGLIERRGHRVFPAEARPALSGNDKMAYESLLATYEKAGFTPPAMGELPGLLGTTKQKVAALFTLAVDAGEIVVIDADIAFRTTHFEGLLKSLAGRLRSGDGITVSELREMARSTRKYIVPLCEYLDRKGFTVRRGDSRFAGSKLAPGA